MPSSRAAGLAALGVLAGGLAAPAPARADWRELRLAVAGGPLLAGAARAEASGRATGTGVAGGAELGYGLSNAVEVGLTLRGGAAHGLRWDETPSGAGTPARLESGARVLYAGPTLRWMPVGDNRFAAFVAVSAGVLHRSHPDGTRVDPATGLDLGPVPDAAHTGFGVAAALGADLRLRARWSLGLRVEGVTALGGPGTLWALQIPLVLGAQFYP